MKEVYIVTNGTYSDYHIESVFSDREKAEKYLEELKKISNDNPQIEEWPVDYDLEKIARKYWRAEINPVTGNLKEGSSYASWVEDKDKEFSWCWAAPSERAYTKMADENISLTVSLIEGGEDSVCIPNRLLVNSFVSQDHANKVAIEKRQEFLRKVDINKIEEKPLGNSVAYYYNKDV